MQRLKSVYPQHADRVKFYAVGADVAESLDKLDSFAQQQGYPWPVARAGRQTMIDLGILSQSSKLAFDGNGVVVYRDGYGGGSVEKWGQVMAELAASP